MPDLAAIDVAQLYGRRGQYLRGYLLDELNPAGRARCPPDYQLDIVLRQESEHAGDPARQHADPRQPGARRRLHPAAPVRRRGAVRFRGPAGGELQHPQRPVRHPDHRAGRRAARRARGRAPDPHHPVALLREPGRREAPGAGGRGLPRPARPARRHGAAPRPRRRPGRPSARRRLGRPGSSRTCATRSGSASSTATTCARSPGRLVEEAQALCLLGGRRLVRVRDAGDVATAAVRDLLALPAQEGFVRDRGRRPAGQLQPAQAGRGARRRRWPCPATATRRGDLGGLVRGAPGRAPARRRARRARLPARPTSAATAASRGPELAKLALYMATGRPRRCTLGGCRRRGRRQLGARRRRRGQRGAARPPPRAGARAGPAARRGRGARCG